MTATEPTDAAPALAGGDRVLTASEAIVAGLVAAGVSDLFGIAGGKFAPLLAAVDREPRLRFTGVRHEAAAAFMATAVAHRTGRLAACVAEMGPGALNLASGLDTAYTNHLPVIAITVGTPARLSGPAHGQLMELDAPSVFGALTRWRATLADPRRTGELLARAVAEALGSGRGPVHLEVGYDVLASEAAAGSAGEIARWTAGAAQIDRPQPDPGALARAAELLCEARRPLLLAGGGVVAAEGGPQLRALAALLDAPVIVTQMGIGLLADDDPALVGQGGVVFGDQVLRALREADVVLAAGCRFSSWLWDGAHPAGAENPAQRLIHLDIERSEIGRLRPAEVALVGDARAGLGALRCALGEGGAADPAWRAGLAEERAVYLERVAELGRDGSSAARPGADREPMHPAQLARALGDAIPDDALVVYDGAHTSFWSNDLTPVSGPRTRFHDPGSGHLGFGVPYAHALALLEPGRPVIDITGDGAFGFSVAELDTAVRLGLRVVHVIHDNQAWGVIGFSQRRLGFSLGTDLAGTDYAAIARGFGAHGERVDTVDQVAPALARALAADGPSVIDARVSFVPHPGLPRFGAMGRFPQD
ncbi:MAG TPA: thiamine pyrophosphate-binding protein [Solirubrobacteraceae bacterium]|nr:thiamine pyrophosphate-binding protein [Solirubrobacteraceae bacterium]